MSASKSQQSLNNRYSSSRSKGGIGRWLLPAGIFAAVALVVVVVAMSVAGGKDGKETYNLVVTPENIDELKAANHETVSAGSYDVSMNSTWKFTNARSASSNAYVQNLLTNSNTVKFTITRQDKGNVIYTSPYIPVGSGLSSIKLEDEDMGKGTYPCVVTYYLLDSEYRELSTVKINISVIIEND